MYRAAALTYTTLLALVPLMTVSFLLVSALPIAKGWGNEIQKLILDNFVADSAATIQTHLQIFVSQAAHLSVTSFLFLFFTAVLLLVNIEKALNSIWRVQKTRKSIIAFFFYLAIITLTPVLIAIAMGISAYIWSFPVIANTANDLGLTPRILKFLPYALTFLAFSLLYWVVPNCKVGVKNALGGGLVATILFEGAKYGFGIYIIYFPTYKLLYGALAAIPLFLVWIYVSWSLILLGAVVSYQLKVGTTIEQ